MKKMNNIKIQKIIAYKRWDDESLWGHKFLAKIKINNIDSHLLMKQIGYGRSIEEEHWFIDNSLLNIDEIEPDIIESEIYKKTNMDHDKYGEFPDYSDYIEVKEWRI